MVRKIQRQSSEQLGRTIRDLKPGQTYQIKTSDGRVFGTIGVPSGREIEDQPATANYGGQGEPKSWFE